MVNDPATTAAAAKSDAGAGVPNDVHQTLAELGVQLAEPTWAALGRYLGLLLAANERFNLTAIRDTPTAWRRHILDSLTLLPVLEKVQQRTLKPNKESDISGSKLPAASGGGVIDVGSGGGLPGLVLAIARPDLRLTLLEATGKKARFLDECAKELGLKNMAVVGSRAETAGRDGQHRQRYDVAVCRAVGPMRELLEYTLPFVKVGGTLLAMKGPSVSQELDVAGDALAVLGGGEIEIVSAYPQGHEQQGVIVVVRKDRPTPKAYPRRPGEPRHTPL